MNKQKAFTLVEMMITVGIAAILIALAAPSFVELMRNNNRSTQVNDFLASMILARSEALKRGNNVSLCRTTTHSAAVPTCGTGSGWEAGWVVFNDPDGNDQPNTANDVLRSHGPLEGDNITLRGNNPVASIITYTASGRTAGTFGTVTWCDSRGAGTNARDIIFPLSGRVRTAVGDGSTSC